MPHLHENQVNFTRNFFHSAAKVSTADSGNSCQMHFDYSLIFAFPRIEICLLKMEVMVLSLRSSHLLLRNIMARLIMK